MKTNRFLQLVASLALALAFTFSLGGCGGEDKPSGTYGGSYNSSYTFEGDKYTIKVGGNTISEGTFKVENRSEDGVKWSELVYTDSKGTKMPSNSYTLKGDTLKLSGSTFIKKK
jgi:major membrane immunogen (membrane-anchored lipoprotein)